VAGFVVFERLKTALHGFAVYIPFGRMRQTSAVLSPSSAKEPSGEHRHEPT
jgi:hypothetical protein